MAAPARERIALFEKAFFSEVFGVGNVIEDQPGPPPIWKTREFRVTCPKVAIRVDMAGLASPIVHGRQVEFPAAVLFMAHGAGQLRPAGLPPLQIEQGGQDEGR